MTDTLKIGEVADRAGVSPAAVRYYERIGVLPPASRTGNGYRTYDERTVERLVFVNRAKRLGCSLDDIADLMLAWEGGECGPIQDRLRQLVATKLADADREIQSLLAFTEELQQAAQTLERHRPVGACDDNCGCITDPDASGDPASPRPLALTTKPSSVPKRWTAN
jgi:MerR family transcriptional regulator, copper efflux regulator